MKAKDDVHADEVGWLARADALCRTGRESEGSALFAEWVPRVATGRYDASPEVAHWRARMGLCALRSGHVKQAVESSLLARAAIEKQPGISPELKAPVLELATALSGKRWP